jgi:hypothetical protein
MGLKFHQGDKKLYSGYTGAKAWDSADLLKNPFNNAPNPDWLTAWNTETKIKETLRCPLSRMFYANQSDVQTRQIGAVLDGDAEGINLWVLKGFHQVKLDTAKNLLETHVTLGLDGRLWHFDCRMPRGLMTIPPHVTGASYGQLQTDEDADGFQKQKKGRGKGNKNR